MVFILGGTSPVFAIEAARVGIGGLAEGFVLVGPVFWIVVGLNLCLEGFAYAFFEWVLEPAEVAIEETGVTFLAPLRVCRERWEWHEFAGLYRSRAGVYFVRKPRKVVRPRGFRGWFGPRRDVQHRKFLSPNQFRAVLAHPACPTLNPAPDILTKLGLD